MLGVRGTGRVPGPVARHIGSASRTVSEALQLPSAASPLLQAWITTWFVVPTWSWQSLVTVRPGVRQSNVAVSCAVAFRFGFLSGVQKQLSDAVSGSAAASVALHVWLLKSVVTTGGGQVPAGVPGQPASETQGAPGVSPPTHVRPGMSLSIVPLAPTMPEFDSLSEQENISDDP